MRCLPIVEHGVADHRAPVGRRRLDAEPEEAQPCDGEHTAPEPQRAEHEERPAECGQEMTKDNACVAAAEDAQLLDVRLCCALHHLRAHNAREPRPRARDEREQETRDTGADKARNGHHETDARNPLKDIAQRREHSICPSAEIAREQSHKRPDPERTYRRDEGEQERAAPAVEHTAEEIAPECIRPEEMCRRGRLQPDRHIGLERIHRCELRGKDPRQHKPCQNDQGDIARRPLHQSPPPRTMRGSIRASTRSTASVTRT